MLVCLENGRITDGGRFASLTIGKKYLPLNPEEDWQDIGVLIENDLGNKIFYSRTRFLAIEEYRESRLEGLI